MVIKTVATKYANSYLTFTLPFEDTSNIPQDTQVPCPKQTCYRYSNCSPCLQSFIVYVVQILSLDASVVLPTAAIYSSRI